MKSATEGRGWVGNQVAQESSLGVESGAALSPPHRLQGAGLEEARVGLGPQGWEEILSQALPSWVTHREACTGRMQVSAHLKTPGVLGVPRLKRAF